MSSFLTHHRRRILVTMAFLSLFMAGLCGQLGYLMIFRSEHYSAMADDLHERERTIKAARGEIVDRNGTVIASNRTVCTVSVVHNQVEEPEAVIRMLSEELELPDAEVRKKVEKRSSREIIKTNVDKADGDRIRSHGFAGVKVDEDYKRYYPYDSLASRVLGFTGADNQGIIGLEVMYEKYLKGRDGKILTLSDAKGVEVENAAEERLEPGAGIGGIEGSNETCEIAREHPEIRRAGRIPGDGAEGGQGRFGHCHEPSERGDLCHGQCPGISSQRPVFPGRGGWGRFRKGKTGSFERHVEEPVHQRYL